MNPRYPLHGDLVLYGVYDLYIIKIKGFLSALVPTLGILGVKFDKKLTFEDHVRGIDYRVSQRISILRLLKRIFVVTLCYFVACCICSPNP